MGWPAAGVSTEVPVAVMLFSAQPPRRGLEDVPRVNGRYVGYVMRQDGIYDFLREIVRGRMGVRQSDPDFRAFRLNGSNEVYAYEEKSSRARVICKFYGRRFGWDRDRAVSTAMREHDGLKTLRGFGLVGSPHHVIRPLGFDRDLNCVLALEYYSGEQFSHAIARSIFDHNDAHLFWRLRALAYFLATLHNRTANGDGVDFDVDCRYFDTVVGRLHRRGRIGQWDVEELTWLRDRWRDRSDMWQDRQVWLHGDATPANFMFGGGMDVGAIDLERMRRGDRAFDLGRVIGEVQHAFMAATGDRRRAEPFIGHLLWEYSCHFPDRDGAFRSTTARTPFYMALNLLRIARNDYIDQHHAGRLVEQAKRTLRAL